MKREELDYLLYAVTDFSAYPHLDPVESCRLALRGGASILQLRQKNASTNELVRLSEKLIPLCREHNACFIVNDDVEAALFSGADGVHIGQHDTELSAARSRLGPDKIIGVSAQTVEQAVAACRNGADYLGVGAVFPTSTKLDADSVNYDTLKAICAVSTVPVVAIGGINASNICRLAGSGISGISVVSALFAAPDIEAMAKTLRSTASRTLFPA